MKIISVNTNGIRAAARKGFFDWLPKQQADFVCIQETKAQIDQLEKDPQFFPEGYHCHYFDAVKKGYSGTAVYSKQEPDEVIRGFGVEEFDNEGRYLEVRVGDLSVISLYAPSGSSGEHRQASKDRFLEIFLPHLKQLKETRKVIIVGDWNIAHKEIDLKNWRGNKKNSGFLPHERAWMDELFADGCYFDAFRQINEEAEQYTWWSNRGQAWANNTGWRIDYHVTSEDFQPTSTEIYKDERFSDHAPLILEYAGI